MGLTSNSIAIVMDAVNNLSDAASSVITIIGTKLARKEADKKHPFGYGRIEYLSAMVISVLVLYAGITAFIESVKKIITPETPDYSPVALIIVAAGVVVKIVLGLYVKSVGKKVNSDSLINSGQDATLDSIISASTLVAAVVYIFFNISLEAWLGAVIALVIIKSGVEMLRDTLSKILGERADAELATAIKKTINTFPEVNGAYDLVLHNYGPDSFNGSVHIEVADTLSAEQIDRLTRKLTAEVYEKNGVILTAVGVYSSKTKDKDAISARKRISEIAHSHEHVMQIHGFYFDKEEKSIRFDLIVSFDAKDRAAVCRQVQAEVQQAFPGYRLEVVLDTDFSEA
ncbi:cation diffusion facilitator family transporter [Ruminococcus sp.]|uniref:cation diffusion facilitator family transporter n=1 Tax=Ruminococcus sp. TaxID=41978 RepID=UPI002E78AF4F|nr:cation diffusion facilitator family transporter [Ruminococcus sp.]MEE1263009.1 cation diffusion facilitator family transporter [Ruminococcus sp.]